MKTIFIPKVSGFVLVLALIGCWAPSSSRAGGRVAVWGDNSYGQRLLPNGLRNVKAVAAGASYTLALQADGAVIDWGNYPYGVTTPPAGLSNVTAIAAGSYHGMALRANGTVVAWGNNSMGQLNVPAGLAGVRAIAAGYGQSLALRADGTVAAWGDNSLGETNVPSGLDSVIAIASGYDHNLALRADGTVVAWGGNAYGQTNVPAGLADVVAVAAGYRRSFAVKADGTVVAWGADFTNTNIIPGLSNVVAMASGYFQTLALRADGSVCRWTTNGIDTANLPAGLANVSGLAVGTSHAVAIVRDGPPELLDQPGATGVAYQSNVVLSVTVAGFDPLGYQWFLNGSALTNSFRIIGTTNASLTISDAQFSDIGVYSVLVSNALGMVQSTGATLTVISPPIITLQPIGQTVIAGTNLTLTGSAIGTPPLSYQWTRDGVPLAGATRTSLSYSNVQSSLNGNYCLVVSNVYGVTPSSNARVTVLESPPYILSQPPSRTATLGGTTAFAITARGSTPLSYQWQFNGVDIPGATNTSLTLSALRSDQQGYYVVAVSNAFGQIASSKAQLTLVSVAVWGTLLTDATNIPPGLTNLVAISAGDSHLLALKSDGRLAAWAVPSLFGGHYGVIPTNIPPGLSNVAAIAAGPNYNLALLSNGTVRAWGDNAYGVTNVTPALSNVVAISAGAYHSLALKSDGRVTAWGARGSILPPIGFNELTNVPAGLSNVTAIAADLMYNLALKQDGTLAIWGMAGYTRLTSGLSNIIAIAAGDGYALALQSSGKIIAWTTTTTTPPPPQYPRPPTNVPPGLSNVVALAAGDEGLALRTDGTAAYWTGVTNGFRTDFVHAFAITSRGFSAALTGDGSPHFTIHPFNQTVARGGTVRLHARAAGVQPLTYQWQVDGAPVPGATNGTLIFTNVQGRTAGTYRAVVANSLGTVSGLPAVVTIPFNTNLPAALNPNLAWSTSPTNAAWFAQNRETHDGEAAAQSGHITHSQQSFLQTTVVGPGTLTFWWKVSSEEFFDELRFNLDSLPPAQAISGQTDWQQVTLAIPAGTHLLRWLYAKDSSVSAGQDAGWVDQVLFTPAPPLRLTLMRVLPDGTAVFNASDPSGHSLLAETLSLIEIQASTNLRDWTTLTGACTLTNSALVVRDPDCAQFGRRFYRVVER